MANTATAILKSKPDPRFGNDAGPNPTVIRPVGHVSPLLDAAARIRSRDSFTAASGKPTMCHAGRPEAT